MFKIVDGQGTPLTVVLDYYKEHKLIPNWIEFIEHSLEKGWNLSGTLSKIEESVFEVYGNEYRNEIMSRIKLWIINKYSNGEL